MSDCIFCKIAGHEIPAKTVLETEQILAFHDVSPQAPVHVLIIPKLHVSSLAATTATHDALLGQLLSTAREVAKSLGLDASGYRTVINTGTHGGQTVHHLHIHVLGQRQFSWPPG